jgi:uncharacterized RDD family membrane protein YckC
MRLPIVRTQTYHPHESGRVESLAGAPLAPFRTRLIAFIIDFLVAFILFFPCAVLFSYLAIKMGIILPQRLQLEFNFHHWYSLIFLVLYFGLATYLGKGQTPGKRLCRIRVVSLVHDHITPWTAIERSLGYGASALEFGFGFLQYFIHPNHQTVHDRIAETIVVEVGRAKRR